MKKYTLTAVMFVAAALLAAIGCWFLWFYQIELTSGENPHRLFSNQLVWNFMGLAIFVGVWRLGWERWLKLSPWLMLSCAILCVAAWSCPPIHGVHRWLRVGPITINVRTLLWPVAALFVAWLTSRRLIRPWMVYAAVGCFAISLVCHVVLNANRLERLVGFFSGCPDNQLGYHYMQNQMRAALDVAKWFGNDGHSFRFMPCAHTDGIIAGIALALGKWSVVCAVALMGIVGGCLALIRKRASDSSKRIFILFFGAILVGTAAWDFLQSLCLVPHHGFAFSLLGYGCSDVVSTWFGLGIVASILRGEDEAAFRVKSEKTWGVSLAIACILISALWWAPKSRLVNYYEPMPKSSELGPYGSRPVRGTILAANGEAIARSVKSWQVHIDPEIVRRDKRANVEKVVSHVSELFNLPLQEVRDIYDNRKSRYIPVRREIDEKTANACQNEYARRCGIIVEAVQRREYPLGADAASVVGWCKHEMPKITGMSGLEYTCEKHLAGIPGHMSHSQSLSRNLSNGRPLHGGTVRATIRPSLQRTVSRVMKESAQSNRVESAWAVVVNVRNGEIAALSSFSAPDSNASDIKDIVWQALHNHAIQDRYEPAGLMKPLVYAIAIDAGCVRPGAISDWNTVAFTNLCHNIGTNVLWRGLKKFRLGKKLGGGMLYGEVAGFVYGQENWTPAILEHFGRGQCLAITGVQLAEAYATLANGGVLVTPYLVESITDASGKTVWKHEPRSDERIVSVESAKAVANLMVAMGNSILRVDGVQIACMASTFPLVERPSPEQCLRYSTKNFYTLCAGFFPADKPEFAVVIGFRKPQPNHTPEKVALPAFKKIVGAILNKSP